jgi:CRP-like cAMP-binding protein
MALLTNEPRTATVVCTEECHVYVLRSCDFQTVLRKSPAFAEAVRNMARLRRLLSGLPR